MRWIKIPSILILGLTMSLYSSTDLGNGFFLEDNGVTVTCDGASSGDSSTTEHNGKLFTKISNKTDLIVHGGTVDAENACTSGMVNMSGWFYTKSEFNKDISHWDTSSVSNMASIFQEATAFNQDIGDWNTSKVTNMEDMFQDATNISIENECKIIDGWNKSESDANDPIYITGSYSGFSFSQCLSSKDFSITIDEDTSHTFAQNDFNFTDYLGGTFDSIYITTLPSKGELNLSSSEVVANQKILVGDIGNLVYTPIANEFGNSYTQFGFIVHNSDDKNSTGYNATINVINIDDAPTDITLSSASVGQSGGANAIVGSLTTTDVDVSDTFTYSISTGPGWNDFNIDGADLRVNNSTDMTVGTYAVTVISLDSSNARYSKEFTITVTDDIAPTLLTLSPADDATGVAVDSNLVMTFNTDVVKRGSSGTIIIKKDIDDSLVERIMVDTNLVSIIGAVVTINPNTTLDFNTNYYVQIEANTIEDSSGNDYAGISDRTSWNFTTVALVNTDATLTASSTITEPVNLPSTADTTGEAVNLFDFTITDGGTSDGLSTDVSQIVLHTSGTADFSKVTWRLNGTNVSKVVGVYDSVTNTLTFSGLTISVANGANETYTLSGYYSTPTGLTDNATYKFSVDGDTDLTLDATKTQMGTTTAVDNGTGTKVNITATKLRFRIQPSNVATPTPAPELP